jgi:hypothetical protein
MDEFMNALTGTVGTVSQTQSAITNITAQAQAAADELKLAIKTQLILQGISTLAVLYLCYVAFQDRNKGGPVDSEEFTI